ncbi:hypothetical protein HJC23_002376 [Cyclotella cryptica]|uniref:Uncharacterized protein n=1 Tax=Cyclotella cryptica TaxID=29204 RepID=A0ABD3QKV8_9STRA|eukprot:CCRYP_004476-RA/>CCRYP_004476-RA protein AED:0.15 eAED:0.15 QI:0/-1/0/1/-1/1/1/0/357
MDVDGLEGAVLSVQKAEHALEAAKRDLYEARKSFDRLMSSRSAAASDASTIIAYGVKPDDVKAVYDDATAMVIFINDDSDAQKPTSPRFGSHGTVGTADNTSYTDASRVDLEEDDDPGYLEFLSFIRSGPPPSVPTVENKTEVSSKDEDIAYSHKTIDLKQLTNLSDLFLIPEEASVGASVSSIADASTSRRADSFTSTACTKVVVYGCTPDAIHVTEGVYHKFGMKDGVPSYSKIALYEGRETMFHIARWRVNNGLKKWYITGIREEPSNDASCKHKGKKLKKLAFYYAYSNDDLPPADGWMECTEGKETFLSPAYVARGCSLGRSFEYPSPICIEKQWRSSSFWSKRNWSDRMTL